MSAAYIPGYKGSGGSIGLADPNQGYTIAFTHNRLTAPPHDSAPHNPTASAPHYAPPIALGQLRQDLIGPESLDSRQ